MESGRLNLDSVETNGIAKETVVATYKALPDDDTVAQEKVQNTAMGKQNNENEIDDGVHEKMLKDESKNSPTKETTEVKYISENGDTKIDIETVKQAFCGMGKEELMKFANDPFWIRLRWFLFIAFWLLWIAMLVGAIAIVVIAPKCTAPEPKEWWEISPIIQLDPAETNNHNLKSIESLLDILKEQNINAISLSSIVKENPMGGTEDFKNIKSELGTISDLESLIKYAEGKDQHIILELDPSHTSTEHPWFKRSIEKEEPFTSYYVWADAKITSDGKHNPPNNWLSVYGGSAWEWNEQRGQYYLHQFNYTQPELNYNNPTVVTEFADILSHWIKLGISGFRLANTQYLTEDPDLHDEFRSTIPTEADDYDSLVHAYTRDRPENVGILSKWKERVYNETENKGFFALQDDIGTDILQVYNEKKRLIDLPQNSQFFTIADSSINATTLHRGIYHCLNSTPWPAWDVNGKKHSLRERMPADIADSLVLMTLLLPGTPVLKVNDTLSAKDAFATLSKTRQSLTFLYGETMLKTINGSVFAYTRLKSGNPGYLVAYQSSEEPTVVDFSVMPQISDEVSVVTHSPNYVQDGNMIRTKLPSNKVPISSKSTVVLTFVPKS
ncbi:Neutral and basic amino acid transport protein rBAT [Eufriesea mexicana]|uniref:neutral and basic amino acid transport protein rBAT isoform X2 n=1 Tax=Eufriesea mexicana TaxID=516756 RepID=UPI00083C1B3C|nr:PREDICTED: neutral and basic amino acid transport protein rBAT isoform X2 [Eufriesea mexicana]OAD56819.1 Neutral and basic amino acid transport protein rBAT [Eufriesea mexicana]